MMTTAQMHRFATALLIIGVVLLTPTGDGPRAESSAKEPKIYMVLFRGITESERGFMDYFSEHGIAAEFIIRDCEKNKDALPAFVEEIRTAKPDLVYAFGTTVTQEIAGTVDAPIIDDIPVVFSIVADPVGAQLVPSLEGSGRNLTGTSHLVPLSSQLAALRSVLPAERIGVIFNPQERNSVLTVEQLERLGTEEKYELIKAEVPADTEGHPDPAALPDLVLSLANANVDLIYLPSDSFVISNAGSVVEAAHARGLPTFSATETPIRQGGAFMGLVSRYYNVGQFAAYKAEQILKHGKNPATLPIETLNRFSFVISLKAAHALNLYPPVGVFRFAEIVQ